MSIAGRCWGRASAASAPTRYLSFHPDHLSEVFITGGIPVLGNRIEDVYRETYRLTAERTRRYFERYPADRPRLDRLLDRDDIVLPGGDRLTQGRVRALDASSA